MMHFNPNPPFKAYYFRQIDPVYEELRQQAIQSVGRRFESCLAHNKKPFKYLGLFIFVFPIEIDHFFLYTTRIPIWNKFF